MAAQTEVQIWLEHGAKMTGVRRLDRRHMLQYEVAWRTLDDPASTCSPAVRAQLGDSLKSALTYTFRTGAYDDDVFPLSGRGFRC